MCFSLPIACIFSITIFKLSLLRKIWPEFLYYPDLKFPITPLSDKNDEIICQLLVVSASVVGGKLLVVKLSRIEIATAKTLKPLFSMAFPFAQRGAAIF
ncbi:MAG: hypothetical protein AB4352_06750 [Hormoscilla sp.]